MVLKIKNLSVVLVSSLIVALIFASILVGYFFYIQWKEDSFATRYRSFIYKSTADIFSKDIKIDDIRFRKPGGGYPLVSGAGMPYLEGRITNNSTKIITSLMMEVSFSKEDGEVVYRDWFYPMGEEMFSGSPFFSSFRKTGGAILPGESVNFRYPLKNCPAYVYTAFERQKDFAKVEDQKTVISEFTVKGMSVV